MSASEQMDTSSPAPTPQEKAALATVLSYLRTKKLKDTEEALRKELSVIGGQSDLVDTTSHHAELSPLQASGTDPSKYADSYSHHPLSATPSSLTKTDLQSATSTSTDHTYSPPLTPTADNDGQLRPNSLTVENSSTTLPNLICTEIPSKRPEQLVFSNHLPPNTRSLSECSSPAAPSEDNEDVKITLKQNKPETNGSHSILTPTALAMGGPLLYQTNSGLGRQILTPVLTVLPTSGLLGNGSAQPLQVGGQPIIFSTTTATSQPQMLASSVTPSRVRSASATSSLPSPIEPFRNPASPPRTLASLMMSEMTPQYMELKNFAEEFKTKRIRLGYTQGAVGQSLSRKGYNNFAQSTISRFEQMQLSPANAAAIKQVLEKWLQEAESPDTDTLASVSSSTSLLPSINCRKRKKRAVFTAQTRNNLDEFFKQNPRPNRQLIENIASELGLLPEEVRVWFCNKRQKSKQSTYDRDSCVSTSSYIDSPPSSVFESKPTRSPSPKTPFTIEELSKSSVSTTTSPASVSSPVQLSTLGLVRPLTSSGLYPVVVGLGGTPPSPPRLIPHPPIAQTRA